MKRRHTLRFVLEGIEGLVIVACVGATWPLSKRWLANWGSLPEEQHGRWPGDQYVSSNHQTFTRAINIDASAEAVWRWVVQFGLGRAGFYSYELLERIAGIPVINIESIEPGMQSLSEGDEILLHPRVPGIPVAEVEEAKRICFGGDDDARSGTPRPDPARSWSIYIAPTGDSSCRLLVRSCVEPFRQRTRMARIAAAFERPIDFVMEQRMLRTIKRLSELPDQ